MPYAMQTPTVGIAPVGFLYAPDTVQRAVLGTIVAGVDPFWGGGEFLYLKSNDVILCGSVVSWDLNMVATLAPSTANLGVAVAVSMMPAAAGTFFWAAVKADRVPIVAGASVAAGVGFAITAAGTIGATVAGKQMLNAKSVIASAGTVAKANSLTTNGSPIIIVQSADGWYPGITLSGTGVGAGTVASIAPDNRTVTSTANSTATGSVTVTGTNTGFNICQIDRPFSQGAIT